MLNKLRVGLKVLLGSYFIYITRGRGYPNGRFAYQPPSPETQLTVSNSPPPPSNTKSSTVIIAAPKTLFYKVEKGNLIVMGVKLTIKALLFYKEKL